MTLSHGTNTTVAGVEKNVKIKNLQKKIQKTLKRGILFLKCLKHITNKKAVL